MRINTVLKALLGAAAAAAMLHGAAVQAQATADPAKPAGASQGTATTPSGATGSAASGQSGATGTSGTTGQSGATGATGSTGQTGAAAGAGALSKADQKIVMDMARGNMAEIEMAKLAQSKSQNDQVKTFAQQMIDDHTKALAEVQQLATTKGVTLPTELDKKHKAAADKLAGQSGEAFDKAYMAQSGVSDHKKMHSMLASAEKRAKDPDVKALAARIMPTVDQHLKAAQQLKPSAMGTSGSGTSGAGGGSGTSGSGTSGTSGSGTSGTKGDKPSSTPSSGQ